MKTQWTRFTVITLLLFLSRFYDVYTTYLYIPDLKGETNPLVSVMEFGWGGALTVQLIVLCMLVYTIYIYSFTSIVIQSFSTQYGIKEFISMFHFGNPHDFAKLIYKTPTIKHSFLYAIGGIIPKALIIISVVVGTSTTALIYSIQYQELYRTYNIPVILYSSMVIIIAATTIQFYRNEKRLHPVK